MAKIYSKTTILDTTLKIKYPKINYYLYKITFFFYYLHFTFTSPLRKTE